MRNLITLTLLLSPFATLAQTVGNLPGKGMDAQTYRGGFITQLPPAPREQKGDVYLTSDWVKADFTLENDTELKEISTRLDLNRNEFEINYEGNIRILAGSRVRKFSSFSSQSGSIAVYQNAKDFKLNGVPPVGFLREIEAENEMALFGKTNLKLIEASYVAALDAGTKDDKLVKRETYFFAKNATLYEVLGNASKFAAQFGEQGDEIKGFIKANKLSLKNEDHLKVLLAFLSKQPI
jgi:hypothetical protein